MGNSWDVTQGFKIVNRDNVKPEEFNVADLAVFLGFIRVDQDYAKNTTNNSPVLLIELPEGLLMIDGYHRLTQAKENGVATLKGYALSQKQTKEITLSH